MSEAVVKNKLLSSSNAINNSELFSKYSKNVPGIIKYMGSKRPIIDFVIKAISDTYKGGKIYDLFAGTNIIGASLGHLVPIHANDIQSYSMVLGKTYLVPLNERRDPQPLLDEILSLAEEHVGLVRALYAPIRSTYNANMTLAEFNQVETAQRNLVNLSFEGFEYHLFMKNYSGTYWSFDQCVWIDALRMAADKYRGSAVHEIILSSIMYMMSYTSQSTGHFAQYRDANRATSKNDILIYRLRNPLIYFKKKFLELYSYEREINLNHSFSIGDYRDCLEKMEDGSLVYADPPYAFVHYSRFYHALETLVKYDYPELQFKGRYRTDRHQSPFGKRTEVKQAFESLFKIIKKKNAQLVLSYSNTGMISLEKILEIADEILGDTYSIECREFDHLHSTMGRSNDKSKEVKEFLIIAR